MLIICMACDEDFELVEAEVMGDVYSCPKCNQIVSIDFDKGRIEVGEKSDGKQAA